MFIKNDDYILFQLDWLTNINIALLRANSSDASYLNADSIAERIIYKLLLNSLYNEVILRR